MTKKQFLEEHNRLSPDNLQATFTMLSHFQQDKKPDLKDDAWSIEKLRIPFITWLLASERKEKREKEDSSGYRNYPETKF